MTSMEYDVNQEQLLVEQAKTDEQAFSKLYDHYLPLIFGFITRRINDRQEAEDIVSKIFLNVVEHLKSFDSKKSSFKTWLYSVATHALIDHFRRNSKRKSEDLEMAEHVFDPTDTPHQSAQKTDEREIVFASIQKLPVRHQKVLTLRYYSDLTVEEVAQALDVTPNNASVMIHRALKALHTLLQYYA